MYARVTSAQIDPKNIEEFAKIYSESVVPAAKKQKGFRGISLMFNPKTGDGLSIGYWNSEGIALLRKKTFSTRNRWLNSYLFM